MRCASLIILILLCGWTMAGAAELSVNPLQGGNDLRFGRVTGAMPVNREVRVRVQSMPGESYRVYQRWIQPPVDERGNPLSNDAVTTYAIAGSNMAGTLYASAPEPLTVSDQLLYSSSAAGVSDGWTMVYTVHPQHVPAGEFLGRLEMTVIPVGSGSRQASRILDVFVSGESSFEVRVDGLDQPRAVRLTSKDTVLREETFTVSFEGHTGRDLRFQHSWQQIPQNERFEEMPPSTVEFAAGAVEGGTSAANSPQAVAVNPQDVFIGQAPRGAFVMSYRLNPQLLQTLAAGLYVGELRLAYQSPTQHGVLNIPLEIAVEAQMQLDVEFPPGGLRFSKVLPGASPQVRIVRVSVHNNTGKPYVVTQRVNAFLQNDEGNAIPPEQFRFKVVPDAETSGSSSSEAWTPVRMGDAPLFLSDTKGSPETFEVHYQLESFPGMKAGEYSAPVVFSLEEK